MLEALPEGERRQNPIRPSPNFDNIGAPMSLSPGTRLGPYEIVSAIGAGGMGEVYRAKDTQLDRDVAIKVLPVSFALDTDRVARFTREAKTLATLNHPNIAAIYGLESPAGGAGSGSALVMELVEGDDLSALIARGPLPLREALPIAKQIAEALEAAHEQGIVHRDLKPANIKVRADGTVKVLDFGLAKVWTSDSGPGTPDLANSPTLTAAALAQGYGGPGTQMGVILGTAAYMAPEQARGKAVDRRADIWAFGVVLYEMLSGRPAFSGDTITDIIAAVVTRDPDWTAIPASTPPAIRDLLVRCLDKDPKRRLRDIGDARFVLEGDRPPSASSMVGIAPPPPVVAATPPRPWGWMAATAVMAALAIVAVLYAVTRGGGNPVASTGDSFELAIAAPAGAEFQIGSNLGNVMLSPDGTKIAFVASTSKAVTLWIRSLSADDATSLSGTEGASDPFWSPDSKRIGFFANGKLRTVDIAGGLPEAIADAPNGRGGSWSEDGSILFTPFGGATVHLVAASGGAVRNVTTLDAARSEDAHYWPVVLPGGSRFLFFARSTRPENSGVYLGRIDGSAPPVRILSALSSAILATAPSTGATYLLWVRDGDLLAQPFDLKAGVLTGEARPIAKGVRVEASQRLTFASASRTGIIAWAAADAADAIFGLYDRSGRRLRALDIPPGEVAQPALSPDGRRLLYLQVEKGQGTVYLQDLKSGATQRVSTTAGYSEQPSWTPDGGAVIYEGSAEGTRKLFQMPIDSGSQIEELHAPDNYSGGFELPDHRFVIYTASRPGTGLDVMALRMFGDRSAVALAATRADEVPVSLSADGRWITLFPPTSGSPATIRRLIATGDTPTLGATYSLPPDCVAADTPRRYARGLLCEQRRVAEVDRDHAGQRFLDPRGASSPVQAAAGHG